MPLLIKRILAFCIDYFLIALYAGMLYFLATSMVDFSKPANKPGPVMGQIIGFITLTLPVLCYGYFFESGQHKATLGKKWLNLQVHSKKPLLRNVIKFLPWEIAHTGVHWVVFFSATNSDVPIWVWLLLIIPQLIAFSYFISLLLSRGERTIYDRISQSKIVVQA